MKRITFLILSILLVLSCKNNTSTSKQIVKPKIEENDLIKNEKKYESNCFEITNRFLPLPIKGGDELMTLLIENDIESVEYNCDFDEVLIKKLCNTDSKSLYFLPKNEKFTLAILSDECGDNNHYLLLSFKNTELVDYISVYQYYEEMEEGSKRIITDFKVTEDFKISVCKKKFKGRDLKSEIKKMYEINSSGKFIEI